jgi:signal transduction histidine kinase
MRLGLEFFDDQENVASLKAEIIEMEKIVASLLEAERLNVRHSQLTRTNVVIGELIKELLDDFFARETDRISVSLPDEPITAYLDEARITLLLKNLIGNALRYTKPEDGLVELAVSATNDELVMAVTDHGPGLPEDQVARLGEPFYRSDSSRARESGGTGLGLYLATLVANAHEGSLCLLDTNNQGASFEVRIPFIKP